MVLLMKIAIFWIIVTPSEWQTELRIAWDQEKVPVCDHEMPFPYRIEEQKLVSFRCVYLLLSRHSDKDNDD